MRRYLQVSIHFKYLKNFKNLKNKDLKNERII